MNTNQKKSEQLGLAFGTANSRLRKQLLFKYVSIAGANVCFSCEGVIESVDDFSIEHKKPWFNKDPELFWDLDNIAFSHLKCNTPHTYKGRRDARKVGPEGTAWCSIHKDFLPIENFWSNKSRWNGYYSTCKSCFEQYHRPK